MELPTDSETDMLNAIETLEGNPLVAYAGVQVDNRAGAPVTVRVELYRWD